MRDYKYQLILLGTLGKESTDIEALFFEKVNELNLLKDAFKVLNETTYAAEYKSNQPAFSIYFGDQNGNFKNIDIVNDLLNDGRMILPVYYEKV